MNHAVKFKDVASVEKVHNLEGAEPEPDYWTPSRVQRHLLEAFRIDDRLPKVAGPKQPGSAHPVMEYTDEERAEWEAVPIDPTKFSVTRAEEIAMNATLDWLIAARDANMEA